MTHGWDVWAYGKVSKAMHCIVLGDTPLRDRLGGAWEQGLCMVVPEMMPTERLAELVRELHAFFQQGHRDEIHNYYGRHWGTLRRKRASTLRPIAGKIWDLHDWLGREIDDRQGRALAS